MPCYNVAAYLSEAVESVLRQTYPNWELILVDDGSVDGTAAIAAEFACRSHGKIVFIRHDGHVNKGASASRNLGLAKAKGEWVAFLDSDDQWVPDKLDHQMGLARDFPSAGMFCGSSLYWRSWADPDRTDTHVLVGCPPDNLFQPPDLMRILYPLHDGVAPSMNGLLVKRSVAARVGGFLERFEGMYDDQVFLTKIYLSAPVYVSAKLYDRYRQNRPGSLCYASGAAQNYHEYRMRYLLWLNNYLAENQIVDEGIRERIVLALEAERQFLGSSAEVRIRRGRQKRLKARIKAAWQRLVKGRGV